MWGNRIDKLIIQWWGEWIVRLLGEFSYRYCVLNFGLFGPDFIENEVSGLPRETRSH
ncbi:protein of unknown function [Nitratireductor aquimarinus]